MTWTALDTTSAGRFWPLGPLGIVRSSAPDQSKPKFRALNVGCLKFVWEPQYGRLNRPFDQSERLQPLEPALNVSASHEARNCFYRSVIVAHANEHSRMVAALGAQPYGLINEGFQFRRRHA
jgi:hypothetical protein